MGTIRALTDSKCVEPLPPSLAWRIRLVAQDQADVGDFHRTLGGVSHTVPNPLGLAPGRGHRAPSHVTHQQCAVFHRTSEGRSVAALHRWISQPFVKSLGLLPSHRGARFDRPRTDEGPTDQLMWSNQEKNSVQPWSDRYCAARALNLCRTFAKDPKPGTRPIQQPPCVWCVWPVGARSSLTTDQTRGSLGRTR